MGANKFIDRYEVLDVLGKGAMGSVYRAWDPKLRREVAIKVVAQGSVDGQKGRERFYREVCAIAALRHTNIVEIYDYSGMESEHLYYVMEKLEGRDLFNVLRAKGAMPEPIVVAVGHELCLALSVAHDAGIIHRDLKPENVFVDGNGRVVLTDFGVVKAVRQGSAVDGFGRPTEVIGTPGFMAPELMTGKGLGAFTDIFALGALLYNLLTGHLPFDGRSPVEIHRAMLEGRFADPREFDECVTPELVELLCCSLDAKPKKRYQSAEEMRLALKGVLEVHDVSDLRDDLRHYMRDTTGYLQACHRRDVAFVIERLKVAVKDKDADAVERLQKRLTLVDPRNTEVSGITGVFDLASMRAAAREKKKKMQELEQALAAKASPQRVGRRTREHAARDSRRRWPLMAVSLFLVGVMAVAVWVLWLGPRGQIAELAQALTPAPNPLAAAKGPVNNGKASATDAAGTPEVEASATAAGTGAGGSAAAPAGGAARLGGAATAGRGDAPAEAAADAAADATTAAAGRTASSSSSSAMAPSSSSAPPSAAAAAESGAASRSGEASGSGAAAAPGTPTPGGASGVAATARAGGGSSGTATSTSTATAAATPNAKPGFIQMRIKGPAAAAAVVTLDGAKLGKAELRLKRVPAGAHCIEVTVKSRTLSLDFEVAPVVTTVVSVDLKRGKISAGTAEATH